MDARELVAQIQSEGDRVKNLIADAIDNLQDSIEALAARVEALEGQLSKVEPSAGEETEV